MINRGNGCKVLKSSTKPTTPKKIAGNNNIAANGKVAWVLLDLITAAKVKILIELAIATPPKYGIGSFCVLRSRVGLSIAPIEIAIFRTGQVRSPAKTKAKSPSSRYSVELMLTGVSIGKLLLSQPLCHGYSDFEPLCHLGIGKPCRGSTNDIEPRIHLPIELVEAQQLTCSISGIDDCVN